MASLYRRGKVWWIQYRIDGKNVQRSLDTESEQLAKLKLKQMEGLHASGELGLPSRTPIAPSPTSSANTFSKGAARPPIV